MSNLVQTSAVESALIQGDLKSLTPEQRVSYYNAVCQSVGLNPLTKPFEYIILNGKLTLYAKRDATDQLRQVHGVSITKLEKSSADDLFEVTAYAINKDGRMDSATGIVYTAGLKGENLANARMKAETKAKRRVTLSICGLGLLDETELEDVSREAKSEPFNNDPFGKKQAAIDAASSAPAEASGLGDYVIKFGKKHAGKNLKDMDPFELDNYLKWLKESSFEQGKELSGAALELCEKGEAYLSSIEVGARQ